MLLNCGVAEDSWESLGLARRSNHSILKEISLGCSLEGLMLKLKLQYFGHLTRRADSFEKTLMLWKIESGREGDDRGWDGWMESPTQWTWVWVNSGSWWWTERPGVLRFMGSQGVRHDWVTDLIWWNLLKVFSKLFFIGIGRFNLFIYVAAVGSICLSLFFFFTLVLFSFFFFFLNFIHMDFQFSKYHLLKRLFFFHWIVLVPLLKINFSCICRYFSGLSCSIDLFN